MNRQEEDLADINGVENRYYKLGNLQGLANVPQEEEEKYH